MKLEIRREVSITGASPVSAVTAIRKLTGLPMMAAVILTCGCGSVSTSSIRCPDDPVAKSTRGYPDFSPYNATPKGRVGSIPCTGPLTFYATADPEQLGTHSYGSSLGGEEEGSRGIVYTLHGGFIDIAHVRKVVDWTVYHQVRIRHALDNGWNCIVLPSKEGSVYRIRFNYPSTWQGMTPARRQQVVGALSIRLAQRLAIIQTEWHEIATWFGYSCTLYPEKPSAFTYDDMTSHLLGSKIAGLALHDGTHDFNSAVTYYLKRELDRLGAVPPDQTLKAVAMVKNKWWKNGFVIRRQFDIGERNGLIEPWIVPGFPNGRTEATHPFSIPSLKDVAGMDMSGIERVEVDPHLGVWSSMRKVLPGNPRVCRPTEDFPVLMRYIRAND
ncbi:MAG: DUF4056 domain-containing protein [Verrucomicrobiota bacterium]